MPDEDADMNSICDFCAVPMPLSQSHTCYRCGAVLCSEHESPIDHACTGEDPE